ncbi:MAG TPA: hypothetical protein VK563_23535 [Puia sp.]|nr:hypothetical protein [Puia sp.]
MKYLLYTGLLLLSATACHQKDPSSQSTSSPADTTRKSFFPVAGVIRSEISYLDSTPLAIRQYVIEDNRTDSAFINLPTFHKLAGEFIPSELTSGNFEKDFIEKSFIDETTRSATFTYSTQNRDLPLQRVDVLMAPPGADGTNQLKSIYMEMQFSRGDTLVGKKLLWRAKKNFLIITTLQPPGKAPGIQQIRVVWDTDNHE